MIALRGFDQRGWTAAPGAKPGRPCRTSADFQAGFFLCADERKDCAAGYGNVGVAGEFEHAQGVEGFFVAPGVAGDHGDAEDLDLRRLQQSQHGHLV